jgi:anti-anti-sigma regulatory factor
MAVLVYVHTDALERGGSLRLRSAPARVSKALTVAGLDQVFQLDPA